MDEVKSLVESRTFWGAAMSLAGSGVAAFHYTLTPADAASLVDIAVSMVTGIGGVVTIIGRVKASRKIVGVIPS